MCAGSDFSLQRALGIRETEPLRGFFPGSRLQKLLSAAERTCLLYPADFRDDVSYCSHILGSDLGPMTRPLGGPLLKHVVGISWENASEMFCSLPDAIPAPRPPGAGWGRGVPCPPGRCPCPSGHGAFSSSAGSAGWGPAQPREDGVTQGLEGEVPGTSRLEPCPSGALREVMTV